MSGQLNCSRQTAGKGHLGGGNRQAAFAQVVACADQAGMDRAMHGGKCLLRDLRIELAERGRRLLTLI